MAKPTRVTNRITELRKAAGLSQAELGERIGVTRQTVNAVEAGKYSPSLEAAFMIARVLDHPLEESSTIHRDLPNRGAAAMEDQPDGCVGVDAGACSRSVQDSGGMTREQPVTAFG